MVMAGMSRIFMCATGSCVKATKPPAGTHLSFCANTSTSSVPITNTGTDIRKLDSVDSARSRRRPRRNAAATPRGRPMRIDRIVAETTSSSVRGRRRTISSITGRSSCMELPRSKRASPRRKATVLLQHRLFQAQPLAQLRHGRGIGCNAATRQQHLGRIAGDQAQDGEDQRGDDPDQDEGDAKAAEQIGHTSPGVGSLRMLLPLPRGEGRGEGQFHTQSKTCPSPNPLPM